MLVLVIIPASLQTSGIFYNNILSNPLKARTGRQGRRHGEDPDELVPSVQRGTDTDGTEAHGQETADLDNVSKSCPCFDAAKEYQDLHD